MTLKFVCYYDIYSRRCSLLSSHNHQNNSFGLSTRKCVLPQLTFALIYTLLIHRLYDCFLYRSTDWLNSNRKCYIYILKSYPPNLVVGFTCFHSTKQTIWRQIEAYLLKQSSSGIVVCSRVWLTAFTLTKIGSTNLVKSPVSILSKTNSNSGVE